MPEGERISTFSINGKHFAYTSDEVSEAAKKQYDNKDFQSGGKYSELQKIVFFKLEFPKQTIEMYHPVIFLDAIVKEIEAGNLEMPNEDQFPEISDIRN